MKFYLFTTSLFYNTREKEELEKLGLKWEEESEYIIPLENIEGLREAANNLEFPTEAQEAHKELGDALLKFRDELFKQLEPIMDKMAELLEQIRKTISSYIHEFYEELAKTLKR